MCTEQAPNKMRGESTQLIVSFDPEQRKQQELKREQSTSLGFRFSKMYNVAAERKLGSEAFVRAVLVKLRISSGAVQL
jgi:hypothetical protein